MIDYLINSPEKFNPEEYVNAPSFKIMEGVFSNKTKEAVFNHNINGIVNSLINIKDLLTGKDVQFAEKEDVLIKFHNLPQERQKSLVYKAYKSVAFLSDLSSAKAGKFTDWIRSFLVNLSYSHLLNKPTRYARDKDWYTGNGNYKKYKLNYHAFNFIVDALMLLGIVDICIGDDGYYTGVPLQTRV